MAKETMKKAYIVVYEKKSCFFRNIKYEIQEIIVERTTEKFFYYNEKKHSKTGLSHGYAWKTERIYSYHETVLEALETLASDIQKKYSSKLKLKNEIEKELKFYQKKLKELKELKELNVAKS